MKEIGGVAFYSEREVLEMSLDRPDGAGAGAVVVQINGERLYPACQYVDSEETVEGIRKLVDTLAGQPHEQGAVMTDADLTDHIEWLFSPLYGPITPLEWLRLGRDPEVVLHSAEEYLEQRYINRKNARLRMMAGAGID